MEEILLAHQALQKIVFQKTPFTDALNQFQDRAKRPQFNLLRSLTSCYLHHQRLLDYIAVRHFPNLSQEQRLLISLVLGNTIYIKRVPHDIAQAFLAHYFKDQADVVNGLITLLSLNQPAAAYIDPAIDQESPYFLSIKFNTPEWLVTMWIKHFNLAITKKILQANNHPVLQACRVNTEKITQEQLQKQYPQFIKGPLPNTVIYQGKEPLKIQQAFQQQFVFQQRLAVTDIINQFSFENVHGDMLIVETRPQALYLELPIFTHQRLRINVVTNSIERKLAMQKNLSVFNISNVIVYEAAPTALLPVIEKPQDVVMVLPQCSKFDLIRSLPDFFVQFEQSSIDALVAEQQATLNEAAKFVESGGLLFYAINTMNHKEGKNLIEQFLLTHQDYKLLTQQQYLPYDTLNTALYYAALRKQK
jgi:16S rRNA (cytosine967-C5)-methyltransferase